MLATLTPAEYAEFRGALGSSSGFQSAQYRAVEFLLGNKNAAMLRLFEHDAARRRPSSTELLDGASRLRRVPAPTSPGAGTRCRGELLDRDVRRAHVFCPELVDVFTHIYDDTEHYWDVYETCEELVDIEENFQLWRFRHLKTVERMIGGKTRHRRLQRRAVPAARAGAHVLPRAVRGAHHDRVVITTLTRSVIQRNCCVCSVED